MEENSWNRSENAIIDADAHVVEIRRTWDYMDHPKKQYRPCRSNPRRCRVKLQFGIITARSGDFAFRHFQRRAERPPNRSPKVR